MLDVHPPHEPAHGVGDFFLHLFTITIGLLIAVGIEGAVTRHEHKKLADEARETMTEEIRHNVANTDDAVRDIAEQQERMKKNLTLLEKIQTNPKGPEADNADLNASYNSTGLEKTAWHTAQATGALSYMPYEEAQRFSGIYGEVENFESAQKTLFEDEAQFFGALAQHPIVKGHVTKEGADAMAQRFGIWQGHLLNLHIAARVLQEQEHAFLEHREPLKHLSEKIGN